MPQITGRIAPGEGEEQALRAHARQVAEDLELIADADHEPPGEAPPETADGGFTPPGAKWIRRAELCTLAT